MTDKNTRNYWTVETSNGYDVKIGCETIGVVYERLTGGYSFTLERQTSPDPGRHEGVMRKPMAVGDESIGEWGAKQRCLELLLKYLNDR